MIRRCVHPLVSLTVGGALSFGTTKAQTTLDQSGFVLLDFATGAQISSDNHSRWVHPPVPSHQAAGAPPAGTPRADTGPVTLTYQIEDGFLSNQSAEVQANARGVIEAALKTWSDASNNFVRFVEAAWDTVPNDDAIFHPYYAGPSNDWWCANYCSSCSVCPGGTEPLPDPIELFPGWGADIDFLSRPTGFTLESNGILYQMGAQNLAFAAIHRAGNGIFSVDIYFNEDMSWTTDAGTAFENLGRVLPMCSCKGTVSSTLFAPRSAAGSSRSIYDLETVALHEIGHALGLDHADQACANSGAIQNPFTFAALTCSDWSSEQVMHGAYSGVKRTLTQPDIGGLAFLYRPQLLGDLNSDDRLTVSDAISALDLVEGVTPASAYDVNVMDFLSRNGKVDVVEASQVIRWVIDPSNTTPGELSDLPPLAELPATITLSMVASRWDIGLENTIDIEVRIDNPQMVPLQGWEARILYNESIFSNPQLFDGDVLSGPSFLPPDDGGPGARFTKIGFLNPDASPSGVLGVLRLTVNLAAAEFSPTMETVDFASGASLVVTTDPNPHDFGTVNGETLLATPEELLSYFYDADASGTVDAEDLYQISHQPIDVNKDGMADDMDVQMAREGIRSSENQDIGR